MSCMGLYIRQNVAPEDILLVQQHQVEIGISPHGVFLLPADWFFSLVTLLFVDAVDIGRRAPVVCADDILSGLISLPSHISRLL